MAWVALSGYGGVARIAASDVAAARRGFGGAWAELARALWAGTAPEGALAGRGWRVAVHCASATAAGRAAAWLFGGGRLVTI